MQEVASDNGMQPVTGPGQPQQGSDVGGLIAAVESKMAELMAWHAQQTKQLETDKTVLQAQADKQHKAISSEREALADERQELDRLRETLDGRCAELDKQNQALAERVEQVDQQRVKLVELTSKLRAEESAMSREWADVQRGRESVERASAELAKLREKTQDRAKQWLDETAEALSQPLKLADSETVEQGHDGEQHHAA